MTNDHAKIYSGIAAVTTGIFLLIYGVVSCPPGVIDATVTAAVVTCFGFATACYGLKS